MTSRSCVHDDISDGGLYHAYVCVSKLLLKRERSGECGLKDRASSPSIFHKLRRSWKIHTEGTECMKSHLLPPSFPPFYYPSLKAQLSLYISIYLSISFSFSLSDHLSLSLLPFHWFSPRFTLSVSLILVLIFLFLSASHFSQFLSLIHPHSFFIPFLSLSLFISPSLLFPHFLLLAFICFHWFSPHPSLSFSFL